ncbi:MAG: vesicle coat component [Pycnora praestabilis]|nr:MAG: vesicle coat component [Pycnora praestabilis]
MEGERVSIGNRDGPPEQGDGSWQTALRQDSNVAEATVHGTTGGPELQNCSGALHSANDPSHSLPVSSSYPRNISSTSLQAQATHVEDIEDGNADHDHITSNPNETSQIREATALAREADEGEEAGGCGSTLAKSPANSRAVELDEHPIQGNEMDAKDSQYSDPKTGAEPAERRDFPLPRPSQNQSDSHTDEEHSPLLSQRENLQHLKLEEDENFPGLHLPRRETDLFKLIKPVNHTNSFPDVPPAHNPQSKSISHALPQSQAEDVLEKIDSHSDPFVSEYHLGSQYYTGEKHGDLLDQPGLEDSFNDEAQNDTSFFNETGISQGGEVSTPPDAEARYEEGLPLMLGNGHLESANSEPMHEKSEYDSSGDEDFLNHIPTIPTTEESSSFSPPPLDRKTTTQVLDSLSYPPHHETHDESLQSPHIEADEPKRPTLADLTGGGIAVSTSTVVSEVFGNRKPISDAFSINQEPATGGSQKEDDLAAMWKAALDDDELLDDGDVPMDHGAFFYDDNEGFLDDTSSDFQPDQQSQLINPPVPVPVSDQDGHAKGSSNLTTRNASGAVHVPKERNQLSQPAQSSLNNTDPYATANSQYLKPMQTARPVLSESQTSSHNSPGISNSISAPSINNLGVHSLYPNAQQPPQAVFRPSMPSKAQSFADKSKGGYSSPYDLPMDVMRPRKRLTTQHMSSGYGSQHSISNGPPPRSSSMLADQAPVIPAQPSQRVPSNFPVPSQSPPRSDHSNQPLPSGLAISAVSGTSPPLRPNASTGSFFEELPMNSKPRLSSGGPGRYTPQPSVPTPPAEKAPPRQNSHGLPQMERQLSSSSTPFLASQLQLPERVNPYATAPATAPISAPVQVPATTRYSPAPPIQQSSTQGYSKYSAPPTGVNAPPPQRPFQPRTSSPLAHHEKPYRMQQKATPNDQPHQIPHRELQPRLPSNVTLRGFPESDAPREAEESNSRDETRANFNLDDNPQLPPYSSQVVNNRYTAARSSASSPPPRGPPPANISLNRAASQYQPSSSVTDHSFAPPRRSQTQSPGAMSAGPRVSMAPQDPYQRPASVHDPQSPTQRSTIVSASTRHQKSFSQEFQCITPTDGREEDPLQRWKGCPIFAWGFGGAVVSSFPKDIPRYGTGQTLPMIKRSPGEIRTRSIKDVLPLQEHLANFPGPLRAKGKKKEVAAWLTKSIDSLEQLSQLDRYGLPIGNAEKRQNEKILLWKVLRVLVENDGVLDGNTSVDKAVRTVLSPELEEDQADSKSLHAIGADENGITQSSSSRPHAEPVDLKTVEDMRKILLRGDREKAVWLAVDKRLWAHAMLISSTLPKTVWKQVIQEFVRQEVKTIGADTESLAALYEIFAGNWEESIDELVPPSARAGLQMVSKIASMGPARNALDGLDKWRETLGLVLSNRSTDDGQALMALGRLLSGYGRIEAAHVCYMFARSYSYLGGAEDQQASIALVGADHILQPYEFARDLDSILLSEVYEFALSLSTPSSATSVVPHLQAYKLYHAMILAENGYRNEAQQYCDAIANGLKSTTKSSPYYTGQLFSSLDDLIKRLQNSPKDGSKSWISPPTMGKMSGSVWDKFNKFVAGDESDAASTGSGKGRDLDVGPFAKVAGGTPVLSRSPSSTDLYGSYPVGPDTNPYRSTSNPPYVPSGPYAPRTSAEYQSGSFFEPYKNTQNSSDRSSNESYRGSYESARLQNSDSSVYEGARIQGGAYESKQQSPAYQPTSKLSQYQTQLQEPEASSFDQEPYAPMMSSHPTSPPYRHIPHQSTLPPENNPSYGSYEPTALQTNFGEPEPSSIHDSAAPNYDQPTYESPPSTDFEAPTSSENEPPSYNPYSPPTYEPQTENSDVSPVEDMKPKKSFMDTSDDDVDFAAKAAALLKAQKDQEATAAFLAAAEADAKKGPNPTDANKKGWFGWFGGKKDPHSLNSQAHGPIRAKLGEENSFYYDPDLKKWINKKTTGLSAPTTTATPPPPKGPPSRTVSGTSGPQPLSGMGMGASKPPGLTSAPSMLNMSAFASRSSQPPSNPASSGPGTPARTASPIAPNSSAGLEASTPPIPGSSSSGSGAPPPPSSRPVATTTNMSEVSSIDDLIGAPQGRKGGTVKKGKKGRGYVDVLGK